MRDFGKMSLAIVQKQTGAAAERIDQQIQIAIPIDIREDGASRILICTRHARRWGDVFEFPIAQITIEDIGPVEPAKI